MKNEDNPFTVYNDYTWQVTRKIKFEVIAQVNIQDATSHWVYFTMQAAPTTATDKSPTITINIGRIGASSVSPSGSATLLPLQNTILCTGYTELEAGMYFSIVGNCVDNKHCGNVNGMSIAFREIFST